MKYFLDTADVKEIERWKPYISGVTTNPIHMKEWDSVKDFLTEGFDILDGLKVFFQVTSLQEVEDIRKIIQSINKPVPGMRMMKTLSIKPIFKVTMHRDFHNVFRDLKNNTSGYIYQVAATTMYDMVQINQAIDFNCDYTMVYHHKNKDHDLMDKAFKLKKKLGSDIKLVGASFRTKEEVELAITSGMDYATVRPEHMSLIFKNEQLEADFNELYA